MERRLNVTLNGLTTDSVLNYTFSSNQYLFNYPCSNPEICVGYKITFPIGTYKLEAWGAEGGKIENHHCSKVGPGGPGGYSSGVIIFAKQTTLYLHIGAKGHSYPHPYVAYNGGSANSESSGGGGGTDFRTSQNAANDVVSYRSRVLVAGAGGGTDCTGIGGGGGGVNGGDTLFGATGGSQNTGGNGFENGKLWCGGNVPNSKSSAGGGGGYYGGGSGFLGDDPGAGGSSYISGYPECKAINSDGTPSTSSVHFSKFQFTKGQLLSDLTPSITSNQKIQHRGNGAARITLISNFPFSKYHRMTLSPKVIFAILIAVSGSH